MRRREDKLIHKHTLNLFAGDYETLQTLYGNRVGAAKVIRDLVHAHIRRVKETAAQRSEFIQELDIDLGVLENERTE